MVYNDNLISDFDIAFIDQGIRLDSAPDNYKIGMIYEVVGENTVDEEGNLVQGDISGGISDENRQKLVKRIATMTGDNEVGTITSKGETKCFFSKLDPMELTFDNHMEYYRGIDNLRDNEGNLNHNALRVFKVYAYMIKTNEDGSEDYYFSDAVTLQMYELATS